MPHPIAFIGLGIMGEPMAGHLLAAGHTVVVHSRTKAKAEALIARGAIWADNPAEAARGAEMVFVCVTDTPDVKQVLLGNNGVVHAARAGTVVVDHSTISPTATRDMADTLAVLGMTLIDAPVSGGDAGARAGTLSIMCGGDQAAFERIKPFLRVMGKTITHCGPSGAGQVTKLVNQILVSVTLLAVSEALILAEQGGLDATTTLQAVGAGAAKSWQLENLGPKIATGDHAPGFMIDLMQKDLRLVTEFGAATRTPLPATALVQQLFTAAQAAGRGRDGTQALQTVLKKLARP